MKPIKILQTAEFPPRYYQNWFKNNVVMCKYHTTKIELIYGSCHDQKGFFIYHDSHYVWFSTDYKEAIKRYRGWYQSETWNANWCRNYRKQNGIRKFWD